MEAAPRSTPVVCFLSLLSLSPCHSARSAFTIFFQWSNFSETWPESISFSWPQFQSLVTLCTGHVWAVAFLADASVRVPSSSGLLLPWYTDTISLFHLETSVTKFNGGTDRKINQVTHSWSKCKKGSLGNRDVSVGNTVPIGLKLIFHFSKMLIHENKGMSFFLHYFYCESKFYEGSHFRIFLKGEYICKCMLYYT